MQDSSHGGHDVIVTLQVQRTTILTEADDMLLRVRGAVRLFEECDNSQAATS